VAAGAGAGAGEGDVSDVAPDYVEPFTGWRVWRVVPGAGAPALGSVVKPTVWPRREPLVAACLHRSLLPRFRRRTHDAPEAACECGIYATELDRLGPYVEDVVVCVIGRVALWGTVVECERGSRASHAYPLELFVPQETAASAGALAEYDVPVRLLDVPAAAATAELQKTEQ
jgi:hypothetical protein